MKLDILDNKGEKAGSLALNKGFGDKVNHEILVQYVRTFLFNKRQGNSSVKTRAEVSGSGAKPWKQKGTGRARVGDKRTPIWRHGGIIHGPKPKSWSLVMNKKVKQNALLSALNQALSNENVIIVSDFNFITNKTKDAVKSLNKFNLGRKALLVSDKIEENLRFGLTNIKNVSVADTERINAYQIMDASRILFSKAAFEKLEKRLFGIKKEDK